MPDQVSIDEAIQRLVDANTNNASKINKLEGQIDDICKNFEEYKDQITRSTKEELRRMSEELQAATTVFKQETNDKFEEIKYEWRHMHTDIRRDMDVILFKLHEESPPTSTLTRKLSDLANVKEDEEKSDIRGKESPAIPNIPERPFHMAASNEEPPPIRTPSGFQHSAPDELSPRMPLLAANPFYPGKHSIIVPPASAAPAFYGKNTESPTQFLIRVQEYAESVHAWDRTTLVNGISQFLRDSALEWYCQLRLSHRRPNTWTEFEDLFLAQFNSPVRKARQEQEWHECKQKENETINEFLVRLRALWREQKPKETEKDLVKHLFCRMRNDLLNMIGVSCHASLDEVITEVQQIEDVLYRRAKGERLAKQPKRTSATTADTTPYKRYNEDYTSRATTWTDKEDAFNKYNRRTRDHQVNEMTPHRNPTTAESNTGRQSGSYGEYCYRCGGYGHWTSYCPMQYGTYRQERNKFNSKNVRGALGERTSRAPM
jgi:hypothetical protein